jgi:ribosomal protein S18 acetylase RimI-like enzyme
MEIRILTVDDAGEWLRLRLEALEGDPEAFGASFEEYQSLSLEDVKKRLWSSDDAFVTGAFEDGRLAGMAGFYREKGLKTRHKGYIWGVYITPAKRGIGIGRSMLQALLGRAAKVKGVEQILLTVATPQEAAVRLYRSLGFETFGREPRALRVGSKWIDEEYMILRLTGE